MEKMYFSGGGVDAFSTGVHVVVSMLSTCLGGSIGNACVKGRAGVGRRA